MDLNVTNAPNGGSTNNVGDNIYSTNGEIEVVFFNFLENNPEQAKASNNGTNSSTSNSSVDTQEIGRKDIVPGEDCIVITVVPVPDILKAKQTIKSRAEKSRAAKELYKNIAGKEETGDNDRG